MLRLDHFAIHIDNDLDKLSKLKQEFEQLEGPERITFSMRKIDSP